jgi:uncharacterized membrane protein
MNKGTLQHAMVRKKGRNTSVSRSFTLIYSNSELVVAVLLPSCCAILSFSFSHFNFGFGMDVLVMMMIVIVLRVECRF